MDVEADAVDTARDQRLGIAGVAICDRPTSPKPHAIAIRRLQHPIVGQRAGHAQFGVNCARIGTRDVDKAVSAQPLPGSGSPLSVKCQQCSMS